MCFTPALLATGTHIMQPHIIKSTKEIQKKSANAGLKLKIFTSVLHRITKQKCSSVTDSSTFSPTIFCRITMKRASCQCTLLLSPQRSQEAKVLCKGKRARGWKCVWQPNVFSSLHYLYRLQNHQREQHHSGDKQRETSCGTNGCDISSLCEEMTMIRPFEYRCPECTWRPIFQFQLNIVGLSFIRISIAGLNSPPLTFKKISLSCGLHPNTQY